MIIDRDPLRTPTRRRLTEVENEVQALADRVDALLDAVSRIARQQYRSPHLPENVLTSALRGARRR